MVRPGYGDMRASTADRERAIDVLKAAFAEGRLNQAEYADRVGLVYSSRTYADLAALTADLPVGPFGMLPPAPMMPMPYQPMPYQPAQYQPTQWQPPYPPYQPMAWQPPPPPMPPPPATRQTNGMALAAFLFGLGGYVTAGVTAPLAIGFAIVAAARIRQTGESGTGLVIAGLILAIANLIVLHTIWF